MGQLYVNSGADTPISTFNCCPLYDFEDEKWTHRHDFPPCRYSVLNGFSAVENFNLSHSAEVKKW